MAKLGSIYSRCAMDMDLWAIMCLDLSKILCRGAWQMSKTCRNSRGKAWVRLSRRLMRSCWGSQKWTWVFRARLWLVATCSKINCFARMWETVGPFWADAKVISGKPFLFPQTTSPLYRSRHREFEKWKAGYRPSRMSMASQLVLCESGCKTTTCLASPWLAVSAIWWVRQWVSVLFLKSSVRPL